MSPADSPFAPLPAPGPHPAPAELRAYAAGTLALAEQHRIEAHALDCARCADVVAGYSMSDAATTDRAVAALRTRLQARLGTAVPDAVPARRAWPRLAAAAALLGAVIGGVWNWEQHAAKPSSATARLETTRLPAPTPPSAPLAVEAVVPEVAKTLDYAAVAAAPPPRRTASGPVRRAAAPAGRTVVADLETLAGKDTNEKAVAAATAAALPTQGNLEPAPAASRAAGDLAKENSALLAANLSASDTVISAQREAVASRLAKAKVPSAPASAPGTDNAAAARVAATGMPAAPAISPAPVSGSPALREYLRRQAAAFVPENNASAMTGAVQIKFVVGADGKLSNLKITRGLRADYDAEALRIVCDGPAWRPGIADGRRAALPMEVAVPF